MSSFSRATAAPAFAALAAALALGACTPDTKLGAASGGSAPASAPAAAQSQGPAPEARGNRVTDEKLGLSYVLPAGYVVNPSPEMTDPTGLLVEFKQEKQPATPVPLRILKITQGSNYSFLLSQDNQGDVELLKKNTPFKKVAAEDILLDVPGLPSAAVLLKASGGPGPEPGVQKSFNALYGEGGDRWIVMADGLYPSDEDSAAFPEKALVDFARSVRRL